ncbi:MAG: RagB/SusD family nutrient uptake outer membrane protein [Bacteroides cellulosilyticus]
MYQLYYQTIKACNYAINNAERTPVEKSFLEPRLGQAYFLRALNYFMLVRIWGRIPLVTENRDKITIPQKQR